MPDPRVEDLERAASLHWQAPETEPLGEWRLRAAAGFTGRANSALPVGDPGLPLPEAVAAVEDWYRRRDLRPMIVLPQGAGPDPLPAYLAERSWLPRPGPAFVMTAEIADIPAWTDTPGDHPVSTNLCFGGDDLRTLFAVDGGAPGHVYCWTGMPTPGQPLHQWGV